MEAGASEWSQQAQPGSDCGLTVGREGLAGGAAEQGLGAGLAVEELDGEKRDAHESLNP